MIIAVTGGKGGTGKSTIATSLAHQLSEDGRVLLVDADVDCPDDHLILGLQRKLERDVAKRIPVIDDEKCIACSNCVRACKTKALVSIQGKPPLSLPEQCNGCGACALVCPKDAISWSEKVIGKLYSASAGRLDFISGELEAGEPLSERVVDALIELMEGYASYDFKVIDTAAGTHCPVISALSEADRIIAVTEPTPLGAHDLDLILELAGILGKETMVVINKSDMGDDKLIESVVKKARSMIALRIPFSMAIQDSSLHGNAAQISGILDLARIGELR